MGSVSQYSDEMGRKISAESHVTFILTAICNAGCGAASPRIMGNSLSSKWPVCLEQIGSCWRHSSRCVVRVCVSGVGGVSRRNDAAKGKRGCS